MYVIVCGGRNYNNREKLYSKLDDANIEFLIVGGAKGADTLAEEWAQSRGVVFARYTADWNKHGKAAGFIRNREMLAGLKAVKTFANKKAVFAFPGGKGTANMVKLTRAAGIFVKEFSE